MNSKFALGCFSAVVFVSGSAWCVPPPPATLFLNSFSEKYTAKSLCPDGSECQTKAKDQISFSFAVNLEPEFINDFGPDTVIVVDAGDFNFGARLDQDLKYVTGAHKAKIVKKDTGKSVGSSDAATLTLTWTDDQLLGTIKAKASGYLYSPALARTIANDDGIQPGIFDSSVPLTVTIFPQTLGDYSSNVAQEVPGTKAQTLKTTTSGHKISSKVQLKFTAPK